MNPLPTRRYLVTLPTGQAIPVETAGTAREARYEVARALGWEPNKLTVGEIK